MRDDAEVIVVLDTSRSMLAQTGPRSRDPLRAGNEAALRFRAAFEDVPVGIASFTDRVLPHLFPSSDEEVFVATLSRSLGIERPPPHGAFVSIATRLAALGVDRQPPLLPPDRPQAARLRDHRRRERPVLRRGSGRVPPTAGVETIFLHVWNGDERVFDGNQPEPQYSPDPRSRAHPRPAADDARRPRLLRERARRSDRGGAEALGEGTTVVPG